MSDSDEAAAFNAAMARTRQSLAAVWLASLAGDPDRILLSWQGDSFSLGDVHRRAAVIAREVYSHGVVPGKPVGVMLDNHPDHVATILALALAGAVWVPLDRRLTATAIGKVLEQVELSMIVAESHYHATIAEAPYNGRVVTPGSLVSDVNGAPDCRLSTPASSNTWLPDNSWPNRAPDDLRAILFTSGSTGRPKGVQVTEQMLLASGHLCGIAGDADRDQVFYVWEPLNHIGGAQLIPMALFTGARLALTERFSVSRFWPEVIACGATRIHYLGGIVDHLLSAAPSEHDRAHRVTLGFGAGASVAAAAAFEQRFGVPLREVYGQTEASSFATINAERFPGSIGRALPCFDVRLVDGEITLSSRVPGLLTPGYFGNEAETAKALRHGRFHTGDLARQDESGRLFFVGRTGDRLRVHGENVSAWEVEAVLRRCPGVVDAAVVGIAVGESGNVGVDGDFGTGNTGSTSGEQEIVAWVQLSSVPAPADVAGTAAALIDCAAKELAVFQLPRFVLFVDELPRTPSQRVEKHRLSVSAEMLASAWDRRR